MCGRYVIIEKLEAYELRFNAVSKQVGVKYLPNFNVTPGSLAPVITNDKPDEIQFFHFGLTPFWAKKPMYLINARSEGDHNPENDPTYHGAKGILSKPSFRKPIRLQRCLVLADYFIEGTIKEKLDKPFLVYLKNNRPFAFAGIWDEWANTETGEIFKSFAIITTTPNELLQKLPHHRSPVILHKEDEQHWLKSDSLSEITGLLEPYPSEEMNAYPISNLIKNPRSNDIQLLEPIGDPVRQDLEFRIVKDLKLHGMGYTKREEKKK
ncbi:SOS response-associated peptidase [soil metagenome]